MAGYGYELLFGTANGFADGKSAYLGDFPVNHTSELIEHC
jgi:hypothetical protein